MPELPEVETTKRGISPHILGQQITHANIYFPVLRWPINADLPKLLKNKVIQTVQRRGKYLILGFEHGNLLLHLGMSGSLRIVDPQQERKKHDHFEIVFLNGKALRLHDPRRFGAVIWCESDWREHDLIKSLGPEPLSSEFTTDYLFQRSRKKTVAVKNFIMNSHVVVGVGNIYASEALFIAGINPKRSAGKISKARYEKLTEAIKQVLSSAIRQGGTTLRDFLNAEGSPGYFALHLNVYGRENEPCYNCQSPIKHCIIGQRATYYCPRCQR